MLARKLTVILILFATSVTILAAAFALLTASASAAAVNTERPLIGPVEEEHAPVNTGLPTIEVEGEGGTYFVGAELDGHPGTWQSNLYPVYYSYQWLRCSANGAGCTTISGATASTYEPVDEDTGRTLRLRVTALNGAGSTVAESEPSPVIPTINRVETYGAEEPTDETATLTGAVEFIPENNGTPASAEACVEYHAATSTVQTKQCVTIPGNPNITCSTSVENFIRCGIEIFVTGFTPSTEYDYHFIGVSRGQEQQGNNEAFTTNREPPPRHNSPENITGPTISGEPNPGAELTSEPGTWTEAYPPNWYRYKWMVCPHGTTPPEVGVVCEPAPGANEGETYTIPADISRSYILLDVKSSDPESEGYGGPASYSNLIGPIKIAPTNVTAPTITGTPVVGETYTGTPGTWTETFEPPLTHEYILDLCENEQALNCEEFPLGGNGSKGEFESWMIGRYARLAVRAVNKASEASAPAYSTFIGPVEAATPQECNPGTYSATGKEPCTPDKISGSEHGTTTEPEHESKTESGPEHESKTKSGLEPEPKAESGLKPEPVPVLARVSLSRSCIVAYTPAPGEAPDDRLDVAYSVNEPSTITFTLARRRGSPAWAACPPRRGKTSYPYESVWSATENATTGDHTIGVTEIAVARITRDVLGAGRHHVALATAITDSAANLRTLKPGTYVLTLVATNAQGTRSVLRTLKFWVIAPHRLHQKKPK
jgi:Ig domain of plant-specific actin-binding protein